MDRRPARVIRWPAVALAFGPSLVLGLAGAVWWLLAPPDLTPRVGWAPSLAAGALLGAAMLLAAEGLERTLPSFRHVSRMTERALRRLGLPRPLALALAAASSLGEELLFRGVLMAQIGLVGQALLFGAMHPAGRRGWSYPVFVALSGLALGALVEATGRLSPAIAAHLVINATGLLRTARSGRRPL